MYSRNCLLYDFNIGKILGFIIAQRGRPYCSPYSANEEEMETEKLSNWTKVNIAGTQG